MTPTTDHPMTGSTPTNDEKTWGLIAHISAMVSLFLGPLLVLLIKGNESRYVRAHAIEALNFSITLTIGYLVSFPLMMFFIGLCALPLLALSGLVLHVMAGVKAFQGGSYRYPLALRLIKE